MAEEKRKTPQQEIQQHIADHMNRKPSGEAFFPDYPFPRTYHVIEPQRGKYEVVEELDGQVLEHTTEDGVATAVAKFTYSLVGTEYSEYKLDATKCERVMAYWRKITDSFAHEIVPVRQKSEAGYCWHRLDFDMEDIPTPMFDRLMDRATCNREAALAWMGALFHKKAQPQNYLWLHGSGGDGKGVITRLLEKFLDNAHVAADGTQQALNNQFWGSQFLGKRLAIFSDISYTNIIQESNFKKLTGGDSIRIERKQQPSYTARVDTMCIITSNKLPSLTSAMADVRRAIVVDFSPRQGDDGDRKTYEDRLWEQERAGILFKCIDTYKRHIEEYGHINIETEITHRLAASGVEADYEQMIEECFILNTDNLNDGIKAGKLSLLLKQKYRLNDIKVGLFKKYLQQTYGIEGKRKGTGFYYPGVFTRETEFRDETAF